MKLKILGLVIALLTVPLGARAAIVSQTFDSNWSVNVWNYYGTVSALQWQYLPYTPWDPSLGTLQSVTIDTVISGSRLDSADAVNIREYLVTGWAPDSFQYGAEYSIAGGSNTFSWDESATFSNTAALAHITNYQYFTGIYNQGPGTGGAWYYFESGTINAGYSISAQTTLSYVYDPASTVPEPETYTLMLASLGALALITRRRKITKY